MTADRDPLSLAIIAGGQSRRMRRDKAFVELGGKPLIERVIERSAELGQAETILITNSAADYAHLGLPMYGDIFPGKGSLGGIYTALTRASQSAVLVLACDMPFINPDLLRFMIAQLDEDTDIVAPRVDGVSARPCTPYTARPASSRSVKNSRLTDLKIIGFYDRMNVCDISTKRIMRLMMLTVAHS